MPYQPKINADNLTLYLGICATGRATASSTTLDMVAFGTLYNPRPSITFQPSDVGMPIAIVGGGPVDADMPAPYFVQGSLFHTTIAAYVSPTQVTLAAAPTTSIYNTGFATVILYRPCPMAADWSAAPQAFQLSTSIAPGTNDTMQCSVFQSFGNVANAYIDRFGAPLLGQPVYLTSSDASIEDFGGYIDTLTSSAYPGVHDAPFAYALTCINWAGLARRREVPPQLPMILNNVNGDEAFRQIVLKYLQDDGVAIDATAAGPISIACPVANNIGQLLDQVVSKVTTDTTAWYWTTDPWRTFILAPRTATAAPWAITDGTDLYTGDSPYQQSITQTHNQMANLVQTIGQNTLLNTLNVTLRGNGTNTTFNLPSNAGAQPVIKLNGSAQTIGVLGIDTGKDWYWAQDSAVITQDTGGTVLGPTDLLLVTYTPESPTVAQSPNTASLQALQAIEGTAATYNHSFTVTQPILPAEVLAFAEAYQLEYGMPAVTCQFYTLRPGLQVGQLQAIDLPDAGVPSGDYLIATVQVSIVQNVLVWKYTAFGGANIGNFLTPLVQFINRQTGFAITTPQVAIVANPPIAPVAGQNVIGGGHGQQLNFPNDVTQGNMILVVVNGGGNNLTNPPSVTDTQGNSYIQAVFGETSGVPGGENLISILYAFANSTGPCGVGAGQPEHYGIMEFSGVSPTVEVTGVLVGTTPPTLTLASDTDLVVTGLCNVQATPTVSGAEVLLGDIVVTGTFGYPGLAFSFDTPGAGSFTSTLRDPSGSGTASVFASVAFRKLLAPTPPAQTTNVVGNSTGTVTHSLGALTPGDPILGNGGGDVTTGVAGQLVPAGGSTGDVLTKVSGTDYDTDWAPAGGGGGTDILGTAKFDLSGGAIINHRYTGNVSGATYTGAGNYAIALTGSPTDLVILVQVQNNSAANFWLVQSVTTSGFSVVVLNITATLLVDPNSVYVAVIKQ